jgi:hypothetical protein
MRLGLFIVLCACTRTATPATATLSERPHDDGASLAENLPDASPIVAIDPMNIVTRWNDAHNHHDADALAALYAPTMSFYDVDLSNGDAVKRKRDALAVASDYTQSLSDIAPAPTDENNGVFVRFKKTTTHKGGSKSFPGYLYVIGGHIVAEGDRDPDAWGTRYTYCYGAGDHGPAPNDVRPGVFTVSALEAVLAVRFSKAFADLQSKSRARIELEVRDCAHGCAPGDFGTCKEGDVVDFFVVATIGQDEVAAFAINPTTKSITVTKVASPSP